MKYKIAQMVLNINKADDVISGTSDWAPEAIILPSIRSTQ